MSFFKGFDANIKNHLGKPVLICAVENDMGTETIRILLENHALINAQDDAGKTALMHAIEKSDFYVSRFLLGKKADVNVKDNTGKSVLMYAVDSNNSEAVSSLLQAGADVNAQDNTGKTILMHCVIYCPYATKDTLLYRSVERLLAHKNINLNIKDNEGNDAYYLAKGDMKRLIAKRSGCCSKTWCSFFGRTLAVASSVAVAAAATATTYYYS